MISKQRIIIAGAAGRDFHDFNVVFRDDAAYDVVAFTATQIPNIDDRRYPPELSGTLYPDGIPIYPESRLAELIDELDAAQVIFSYSDVSHESVMHLASVVLAAGADFKFLGPKRTMLKANKPVVSICAVRTGSGKSQTSRHVVAQLLEMGFENVVTVRHPMPYGNLAAQAVQRYSSYEDLDKYECTIEEREEYEPYVDMGAVIFAGVDYAAILRKVEEEADIIVWDGGNNDLPFFASDLKIVVVDPHRPGHEMRYHPGETNLRMADVIVINKVDTANYEGVLEVQRGIRNTNSKATVVMAASPISVDDSNAIRGKRVLVVEDGPTLTHGGMTYGAGAVAADLFGAAEIIDPKPYAVGTLVDTYDSYPGTGPVLPAMGYGPQQMSDLEATINNTPADLVLVATPVDLGRLLDIDLPSQRVRYTLQVIGQPTLGQLLRDRLESFR